MHRSVTALLTLALVPPLWAGCAPSDEEDGLPDAPPAAAPVLDSAAATDTTAARLDVPEVLDTVRLPAEVLRTETGEATYYADLFHGRRTASGEAMDQTRMVAAHRSYPFGTRLRVTEPDSGRQVEVRVIDRGPYARGRKMPAVIDLSREAARRLGILTQGRAVVTVEVLAWGEGLG